MSNNENCFKTVKLCKISLTNDDRNDKQLPNDCSALREKNNYCLHICAFSSFIYITVVLQYET